MLAIKTKIVKLKKPSATATASSTGASTTATGTRTSPRRHSSASVSAHASSACTGTRTTQRLAESNTASSDQCFGENGVESGASRHACVSARTHAKSALYHYFILFFSHFDPTWDPEEMNPRVPSGVHGKGKF